MQKRTKLVVAAVVVAILGLAIVFAVADAYFLPEGSTRVDDPMPASMAEDADVLKQGSFRGQAGHDVSGTVKIVSKNGTNYLVFEDYEQTPGPDVFIYLTRSSDPDVNPEEDGVRILIDGGADGGESTKVGTFNQRLDPEIDPADFNGVSAWCDRFNVPFGFAELARFQG